MKVESPSRSSSHSPIEDIIEGFRWVNETRIIRALLLLIGLVSLVGMPYTVLMPVFADKILHGGARGLGILMGATGVGALFGALTLAAKTGVKGLGRWVVITCAGFGVSLFCFAFSTSFWLSAAFLLPAGFAMMLQMACSNTLIQTMVPDQLRGARNGVVLDDVHGHGSLRRIFWRGAGAQIWSAHHGCAGWNRMCAGGDLVRARLAGTAY